MQPVFDLASVHRLQYRGGVDADGHVLEAADLWDDYIEARYRDRALHMRRDADGLEYLEIDGKPSKRTRKGYPATLGRMGQTECVRAKVEHVFGVIKRVFGFQKVCYRGLAKNLHRLEVTAALANLFMVRRKLLNA